MSDKDNGQAAVAVEEKQLDPRTLRAPFQSQPQTVYETPRNSFVIQLASASSSIAQWGTNPRLRDRQLREFWPTENILAGAVTSTAQARAAYSFRLDGPPRTVKAAMDMLQRSDEGRGIVSLMLKTNIDLLTQDNGAFWGLHRQINSPDSAVTWIEHLDAAQCMRTGKPETPVIYTDARTGFEHILKWYHVITWEEMPAPVARMNGMQYSATTRVLRAAEVLRDTEIYRHEKVSGRHTKRMAFVGGVGRQELEDNKKRFGEDADNKGLLRYMEPIIIAGLDPEKPVSVATIDFASLPEDFDWDAELKWYIASLALGFGADYQDFAPLPGGGLGTSSQSEVLHRKSRGKGPAIWMKLVAHKMNYFGILPQTVEWVFDEDDVEADLEQAKVDKTRAETRKTDIDSGVLTPVVARQIMVDNGELSDEYLAMFNEEDVTDNVSLGDEENSEHDETIDETAPEAESIPVETESPIVKATMSEAVSALRQAVKALADAPPEPPHTEALPPTAGNLFVLGEIEKLSKAVADMPAPIVRAKIRKTVKRGRDGKIESIIEEEVGPSELPISSTTKTVQRDDAGRIESIIEEGRATK